MRPGFPWAAAGPSRRASPEKASHPVVGGDLEGRRERVREKGRSRGSRRNSGSGAGVGRLGWGHGGPAAQARGAHGSRAPLMGPRAGGLESTSSSACLSSTWGSPPRLPLLFLTGRRALFSERPARCCGRSWARLSQVNLAFFAVVLPGVSLRPGTVRSMRQRPSPRVAWRVTAVHGRVRPASPRPARPSRATTDSQQRPGRTEVRRGPRRWGQLTAGGAGSRPGCSPAPPPNASGETLPVLQRFSKHAVFLRFHAFL